MKKLPSSISVYLPDNVLLIDRVELERLQVMMVLKAVDLAKTTRARAKTDEIWLQDLQIQMKQTFAVMCADSVRKLNPH